MQTPVDYTVALDARPPREVVIAIARDLQGKYNPVTLGMFTHVSMKPPVLAISINQANYSLQAIRHAREFVIALPAAAQCPAAALFGQKSGRDTDKFALSDVKTVRATKIDCLLLDDAVCNFECKLVAETVIGSHVVLFGEVLASHLHAEPLPPRLYIVALNHAMGALKTDCIK